MTDVQWRSNPRPKTTGPASKGLKPIGPGGLRLSKRILSPGIVGKRD